MCLICTGESLKGMPKCPVSSCKLLFQKKSGRQASRVKRTCFVEALTWVNIQAGDQPGVPLHVGINCTGLLSSNLLEQDSEYLPVAVRSQDTIFCFCFTTKPNWKVVNGTDVDVSIKLQCYSAITTISCTLYLWHLFRRSPPFSFRFYLKEVHLMCK